MSDNLRKTRIASCVVKEPRKRPVATARACLIGNRRPLTSTKTSRTFSGSIPASFCSTWSLLRKNPTPPMVNLSISLTSTTYYTTTYYFQLPVIDVERYVLTLKRHYVHYCYVS